MEENCFKYIEDAVNKMISLAVEHKNKEGFVLFEQSVLQCIALLSVLLSYSSPHQAQIFITGLCLTRDW